MGAARNFAKQTSLLLLLFWPKRRQLCCLGLGQNTPKGEQASKTSGRPTGANFAHFCSAKVGKATEGFAKYSILQHSEGQARPQLWSASVRPGFWYAKLVLYEAYSANGFPSEPRR